MGTSRISSPTLDLESVPPQLQVQVVLLQLLPLLRKLPKKKRRKSQKKNPMTIWDSDFSTNALGSNPTKRRISSLKQLWHNENNIYFHYRQLYSTKEQNKIY